MPQFVLVIAAALAMLFNVFGVPSASGSAAAGTNEPPRSDVMMVLDQILRQA